MENTVKDNRRFLKLYRHYGKLNVKLENGINPLFSSVMTGATVAVGLMMGNGMYHLNIPWWVIMSGFFIGETGACIFKLSQFRQLDKKENQMLDIANKYSDSTNYKMHLGNVCYMDKTAYLSDYYQYALNNINNGQVKKLK